ncbi:MAG: HTTM domain-containing protein, partial [Pirellulales bacterium]|nr:HTTM domain-containing protein [Pirellulales bacterium]
VAVAEAWNRFWFTPRSGETLAVIRIFAGAMLFYTHLVWTIDFDAFFTSTGWLGTMVRAPHTASYFWLLEPTGLLPVLHVASLVVFAMMTVGLFTRVATVLGFVFALSYVGRAPGALFGLDQINVMLAMYLMLAPAGAAYSVDAWRRHRKGGAEPEPSVATNMATRLIQLHMCVVYFFAGTSKLAGSTWWDGYAMWLSVANLEYQSMDMTWLADWPRTIAFLTHVSVLWEITYFALVWPKLSRPIVLILAVALHLGIALFLGMITFGLAMIIANMAFLSPSLIRGVVGYFFRPTDTTQPAHA